MAIEWPCSHVMPGFALGPRPPAEAMQAAAARGARIEGRCCSSTACFFRLAATAEQSLPTANYQAWAGRPKVLSQAERRITARRPCRSRPTPASALLPVLRVCCHPGRRPRAATRPLAADAALPRPALELSTDQRLSRGAARCGHPRHVIRTRPALGAGPPPACPKPSASLRCDGPDTGSDSRKLALEPGRPAEALESYIQALTGLLRAADQRPGVAPGWIPFPRLIAIPGLGLVGIGRSSAEAACGRTSVRFWALTLLAAEALADRAGGRRDTFEMRVLELGRQARQGSEPALARHGSGDGRRGAIGAARPGRSAAQGR